MLVFPGSVQALDVADALGEGPLHPAGAFLCRVQQAELYRVHSKLFADFVHDALYPKGGLGGARGPIRGGLGLVDHHVVALHPAVGIVVAGEGTPGCLGGGRSRIGPCLEGEGDLTRRELSRFGGAHLHPGPGAGRRARGLEHIGPAHYQLDGQASLL